MSSFINKTILLPYYLALKIRNAMYDRGLKKVSSYDVPVVSLGNVTVGGTGKTPHVEYFVRHYLEQGMNVAVISRGYKRKSKGFIRLDAYDKASRVGDEPLQIKRKFPEVTVVVDKNRCRAIERLLEAEDESRPDVIILDDALQYRSLKPSRQVALITYDHPVFNDTLLPIGSLRDLPTQIGRADTIIITKCPPYLNEWEKDKARRANRVRQDQKVLFTTIKYLNPLPIYLEGNGRFVYSQEVILITGIHNSTPLRNFIATRYRSMIYMKFADHHKFTRRNIRKIVHVAEKHPRALLLTTEKDAQRFIYDTSIPMKLKERLFYIPIEIIPVMDENTDRVFDL